MNWPARLLLRSAAAAGSAASARSITNNWPKTSFIARNAAAIPQPVRKNCRLLRPSFGAMSSAISLTRSSKRRCCAVCGNGLNSPFETIWVGTGEWNAACSAGSVCESSDLLSIRPIEILPCVPGSGPRSHEPASPASGTLCTRLWRRNYSLRRDPVNEATGAAVGLGTGDHRDAERHVLYSPARSSCRERDRPHNRTPVCAAGLPMDWSHWVRPEHLRDALAAPNQSHP